MTQPGAQQGLCQKFEDLRLWLTESDWAVLSSPKMTPEFKLGRLVDRCLALGCRNPNERSVGGMVAVMACCHSSSPQHLSADALYNWVLEAKSQFEMKRPSAAAAATAEVTRSYPATPSELHRSWYPQGDGPAAARDLPRYQQVLKKAPFFSMSFS